MVSAEQVTSCMTHACSKWWIFLNPSFLSWCQKIVRFSFHNWPVSSSMRRQMFTHAAYLILLSHKQAVMKVIDTDVINMWTTLHMWIACRSCMRRRLISTYLLIQSPKTWQWSMMLKLVDLSSCYTLSGRDTATELSLQNRKNHAYKIAADQLLPLCLDVHSVTAAKW